jgi:hypothetical protein
MLVPITKIFVENTLILLPRFSSKAHEANAEAIPSMANQATD